MDSMLPSFLYRASGSSCEDEEADSVLGNLSLITFPGTAVMEGDS